MSHTQFFLISGLGVLFGSEFDSEVGEDLLGCGIAYS